MIASDGPSMMPYAQTVLLALFISTTPGAQTGDLAARNRSAAQALRDGRYDEAARMYRDLLSVRPSDPTTRMNLGIALTGGGRPLEAVTELRKVTALAPTLPGGWYALGQAYNAVKQDAIDTFGDSPEDASWRQLLAADAVLGRRRWTEAFPLYRATLERLPTMVSIHDSVARIYERTGHAAWAARERAAGTLSIADCARRKALCEFRAGRYGAALTAALGATDAESRYWRARAANELALAAFKHLDTLADSAERRGVRASVARAEERYTDAIADLKAALTFAPGDPALIYELASSSYLARDFDQAVATLSPLLNAHPEDPRLLKIVGYSLLQLRRLDEALPVLQRAVAGDSTDPGPRLALGQAYVVNGDFTAAVPLIEAQLADDQDGSLHVQLARAYAGLGQRDKAATLLERSQELQRAAQTRRAAAAQRTITPPK
jgi:predicted Zn-dependent protease